jgi:hypothetical protein
LLHKTYKKHLDIYLLAWGICACAFLFGDEMQDLFVDRLGNVTVAGGVARLDFLRMESVDREKQEVVLKPSTRLVIPLDGLMQAIQMLEKVRDQMLKQASQASPAAAQPQTHSSQA